MRLDEKVGTVIKSVITVISKEVGKVTQNMDGLSSEMDAVGPRLEKIRDWNFLHTPTASGLDDPDLPKDNCTLSS